MGMSQYFLLTIKNLINSLRINIIKIDHPYLMDLITAIFVSHVKILSCVRLKSDNKSIKIKVPSLNTFLHKLIIKCCETIYYNTLIIKKKKKKKKRKKKKNLMMTLKKMNLYQILNKRMILKIFLLYRLNNLCHYLILISLLCSQ